MKISISPATDSHRAGAANPLVMMLIASAALVVALYWLLPSSTPSGAADADELLMYCAAGMRYPLEAIVAEYEREFGTTVQLQYGGSNTLLNQLEVSRTGKTVTNKFQKLSFAQSFAESPRLLASLQTFNESDPAGLRYRKLTTRSVDFLILRSSCMV